MGLFEMVYDCNPKTGIPAVTWKLKHADNCSGESNEKIPFDLYQLSDVLRERGWLLPAYSLPANCEKVVVQRVLIRHGCTYDLMELLLEDMERAIKKLMENPHAKHGCKVSHPKGSFNHGR